MRITLLLLLLVQSTTVTWAQQDAINSFTVVAPSGLSMRQAPGLDASRLGVIPYGSKVQVLNEEEAYANELEKIGKYYGYWAAVEHDGQRGYVFSAYLYQGRRFVPSTDINRDYRIFAPGWRCDEVNYDPDLHWYALELAQSAPLQLRLAAHTPTFQMAGDSPYDVGPSAFCSAFEISADDEPTPHLFFGSRQQLPVNALSQGTTYQADSQHFGYAGIVPFPYQSVAFHDEADDTAYYLTGHQQQRFHKPSQAWYSNYELYFGTRPANPYEDAPSGQLLSELFILNFQQGQDYTPGPSSYFHHPRLLWQGDLNADNFPDLIFYLPNTSESCGGSEAYFLLLSERQVDGSIRMRKVAEESVFSCS